MKVLTSLTIVLVLAALPVNADQLFESAAAGASLVPTVPDAPLWEAPRYTLWDNGPFITHFGTGLQGAHESWLQQNLGMEILGFGNMVSNDNRVADQFTVPSGETWNIESVTFFAYQTDSLAISTITAVNVQIWDGTPGGGGTVIWGDTSTNRLSTTSWTNVYRVTNNTTGTANDRPIMANETSVFVSLGPGTYWLDWQTDGDPGLSGPWAPPITVMGNTTTGDGLQSGGTSYMPALDSGTNTPQGFPFLIEGTAGIGNDTCNTAEVITCPPGGGSVHIFSTTNGATYTGTYDCAGVSAWYPDVWYRVTGNGGDISASTCSDYNPWIDTQLLVYDGSCSGLACVAANDDNCSGQGQYLSTVSWPSSLGTDYYVLVSAGSGVGDGTTNDFELTVTCESSCQTLAAPIVTGVGGAACGGTTSETSPILTWNDVADESGYRWELRDGTGSVIRSGTTGPNVTSVDLGTLPPSSYSARVQAFGDGVSYCDGQWSASCEFTVVTSCETLATPTITSVGGADCGGSTTDTSPIMVWTDVANEDGYRWEVRDAIGGVISSGTTAHGVTSVDVGTLFPSNYIARVQAFGDGVNYCDSAWTTYCSFVVVGPCEELPAPTITAIGDTICGGATFDTSPDLSWGDIANESGYAWELRDASNVIAGSGTTGQNVTTVNLGQLEPGMYRTGVRALGDGVDYCDGDWSSSCPFEILGEVGVADFIWWPMQPKQGQRVRFADRATGEPVGWFWEMDDGWTSMEQNPRHSYDSTGTFDVSMECEYQYGTDTKIWTVSVSGVIRCGDEVCEGEETTWSCPADCALEPEQSGRTGGSDRRPTVPAAVGGVGGTGGTFWMTEGWVFNPGEESLSFVFEYTPLKSAEIFTVGPFDLEPQGGLYWENIVEDLFNVEGNGALWIDSADPVSFLTRSYNVSSSGKFGQGVPGIRERLTIGRGDGSVYLIGLREDSRFRSNLFFQEVDGEWVTFRVELFNENGDLISQNSVDVGGHSNELKSLRRLGAAGEDSVYAAVRVVDGDGRGAVIGSVVDNITGDPTTVDPIHLDQLITKHRDGTKIDDENHHLIAVVAHTEGAQNSVWGTRFVINSPEGTADQSVRLVYIPEYDRTGVVGDRLERTADISGGEQIVWEDVLIDLFALPQSAKTQGTLHVYSPRELLITSRTYNEQAGGGTLGQLIKALASGDLIDEQNTGTIIGMSHTPEARTNVGIAAFSEEDTEVELKFFSNFQALRLLGTITRTVEAESHLQITKVFEELGLSSLPLPSVNAVVTVKQGGAVYVYASSVDNASGDPTTIEATRND